MERWVEVYSEIYFLENEVSGAVFNSVQSLPILEDLDAETAVDELRKAIDDLSLGKASGKDRIPPEMMCVKEVLLDLLCLCWERRSSATRHDRLKHPHPTQEQKGICLIATAIIASHCSI